MSILVKNELGWVLDHQHFINSSLVVPILDSSIDKASPSVYFDVRDRVQVDDHPGDNAIAQWRTIAQLFQIDEPFRMDSEYKALGNGDRMPNEKSEKKKRKRKAKQMSLMDSEEKLQIDKVRAIVDKALSQLMGIAKEKGFFLLNDSITQNNNKEAREASSIVGPGNALAEACFNLRSTEEVASRLSPEMEGLFERIVSNENSKILAGTYILPPNCNFLMSDISYLDPLIKEHKKYGVIVVDPPWENKAVKRRKGYRMLDNERLFDLPVPQLSKDGTWLFIWVTNCVRQQNFVISELLPAWKAYLVSTWYWLKVTSKGEPVINLDNLKKKPYECLLLARVSVRCQQDCTDQNERLGLIKDRKPPVSQSFSNAAKVIVSVPCSIHSRKPPLADIVRDFLPNETDYLELFARNLTPGWTSWGNEVLKYQHKSFFKYSTLDQPTAFPSCHT